MITVSVYKQSTGQPVSGARVVLSFSGITRMGQAQERTNSNGQAHFSRDPGDGKVIINGSTVREGRLQGNMMFYV